MKKFFLLTMALVLWWLPCNAISPQGLNGFAPDFNDSMKVNKNYNPNWILVKQAYDKYIVQLSGYSIEPRIPKIVHHIWLGSPFPEKLKQLRQTWIDHNPGWEFRLWTDQDIEELGLINKHLYDISKNYGQKSDIARYEIIYRFGGLYVDTDFECLKSFDVLHHSCDFYVGLAYSGVMGAYNGLMASVAGHPILGDCIDRLHELDTVKFSNAQEILNSTGPAFFSISLRKWLGHPDAGIVVAFPMTYFYPWPSWERDNNTREQVEQWLRPESFAVHHWHVSWNDGKTPVAPSSVAKPLAGAK